MVLLIHLMVSQTERELSRKAKRGVGESKVKFVIGGGDVPTQLAFWSGGYTGLLKT